MPHWSYIRAQARLRHREVQAYAASVAPHTTAAALTAAQLLTYAEASTGLVRIPLTFGDPLLYGAQATLDDGFIYYNAEIELWLALYYQAHEFAHHWLHNGGSLCSGEDVDYTESEDKSLYGEGRIEAYGPHQRREMEANVFAREFLLPSDMLRQPCTFFTLNSPIFVQVRILHKNTYSAQKLGSTPSSYMDCITQQRL